MSANLKPLDQQVMVIIGASSGIGLATAEDAAKGRAKLVLAARSEKTLAEITDRLKKTGASVVFMACNVVDRQQVDRVAKFAIETFGRIDTWVNNAGIGLYGRLDEVCEVDSRLLFDTNFWGIVNGSLAALPHLKAKGGALINLGSEASEAVAPLLGMYSASKHAVKGFTDALRVEIEEVDQAPVSITLIQPTAVDTPFPQHARNYQRQEPKLPDPMIDPRQVAEAILEAAVKPTRAMKVGLMSKVNTALSKLAPGIGDKMASKQVDRQHYEEPPRHPEGALECASETIGPAGQIRGSGGRER